MSLSVRVWDIMDRNFRTIGPEITLGDAMEIMSDAAKTSGMRSLVVVDKKNRPIGVISMRNILDAFKPEFRTWLGLLGNEGWDESLQKGLKQCHYRLVENYMVKTPFLRVNDDLIKAYKVLTEKNLEVRIVPVVEAEEVVGVVRIPELFEAFVDAYRKT